VGKAALRTVAAPHTESMGERALENLAFIRSTMERAGEFTAVPGLGGMLVGLTALGAAALAARQPTEAAWLAVWLAEALLAALVGGYTMWRKCARTGVSLRSGAGRKFLLGFAPPFVAGTLLTWPLFAAGQTQLLGATWLLLFGAAVVSGGAFSARVVPLFGACYIVLGGLAIAVPHAWRDLPLAAGFGGANLIFGWWIYRRHGG
jgi:hypothetical protein